LSEHLTKNPVVGPHAITRCLSSIGCVGSPVLVP
jgi:hypothetical protein